VKKLLRRSTSKLLCVVFLLCTCAREEQKITGHFFALDTVIDVTLYSFDAKRGAADIDSLEKMMQRIETSLSISNVNSEICRINHRRDSVVAVSDTLMQILDVCKKEFASAGGLFDVTLEPLKYLYGLESHQTENHVPRQHELDSVLALTGFAKIKFVGNRVLQLPQGMHLDFGGIAKGYVLGQSVKKLRSLGYKRFMVNAGGDLVAIGMKPSGDAWRIGIQNPRQPDRLCATIDVANCCVFTSGDYQRCFIKDGKRYHHLFDPHTGKPGALNQSATVIGSDPLVADAVVKSAFLLPAEKALVYLATKKMAGFLIDSSGFAWASERVKPFLHPDSGVTVTYR